MSLLRYLTKLDTMQNVSRRKFLNTSASLGGALLLGGMVSGCSEGKAAVPVYGHLWVYASNFPPDWDCTPVLEQVFSDFKYAGIEGVELMESILRNPAIISVAGPLIKQYGIPVTGTSYYADMWVKEDRQKILDDVSFVVGRLHELGGTMFGITVGDAGRKKTESEMDAQAELLMDILRVCEQNKVEPNIHNHTFEVTNNLHDLKGILARIPEIKLGPDISWLARAGVDPVSFVEQYGHQMVYMHLRDQTADNVFTEAVGEGMIDFPAIAAVLKKINYRGKAAIELAYEKPQQRANRENWKMSRDYVSEIFGW